MRSWHAFLVIALSIQPVAWAQASGAAVPFTRQLSGLSGEEANALLAKLEEAQERLKAGEFQSFELLAGSIASYEEAKISPRDAFLQVPFEKVWNIERVRTGNRLWQPYRLSYAPDGLGQPYWDVQVVLGSTGSIERILMLFKPPAPF